MAYSLSASSGNSFFLNEGNKRMDSSLFHKATYEVYLEMEGSFQDSYTNEVEISSQLNFCTLLLGKEEPRSTPGTTGLKILEILKGIPLFFTMHFYEETDCRYTPYSAYPLSMMWQISHRTI